MFTAKINDQGCADVYWQSRPRIDGMVVHAAPEYWSKAQTEQAVVDAKSCDCETGLCPTCVVARAYSEWNQGVGTTK